MKRALAVTWFALRGVYDELFPLVGIGLLWFVIAVLLPYGVFWLTSTVTPTLAVIIPLVLISLIPAPPITAAVYHVTSYIAQEKRIEFSYFWEGFKSYFGLSWKVSGILLVVGAVLAFDILFCFNNPNFIFSVIGFVGVWALLFWAAIQIYLFPLMVHQEDKSLKLILKNASLLTLAYPFFVLVLLIVIILFTALSTLLMLILLATLWMPFISLLNNRALVSSLDQVEQYRVTQAELEKDLNETNE